MSNSLGGLLGFGKASHEDRGPAMKTFSVFMIIIPTVVICLRFWSSFLIRTRPDFPLFWWDDWLALAALAFSIPTNALIIWWCSLGLGKHEANVPILELENGLKCLFILLYFACFAIQLPKLSCLFFYARVFTTQSKPFRMALWAVGVMIIGWLISMIVTITVQCTPVAKTWEGPLLRGHCINQNLFILFGEGVTNIVLDTAILLIPMPFLWNLKTSRSRIFRLTLVFICGYCVLVISVGKTVTIGKAYPTLDQDATWNAIDIFYWTTAEAPFSILSISIPALYALGLRAVQHGPRSLISSKYSKDSKISSSSGARSGVRDEEASFRRRIKPSARNVAGDSLLNDTVYDNSPENEYEAIELRNYSAHRIKRKPLPPLPIERIDEHFDYSVPSVPSVPREESIRGAQFGESSTYAPAPPRVYRPSTGWI